jgi:hypothetical protein
MTNSNVFNSMMKFSTTKFHDFYKSSNSVIPCYLQEVATIGWVASYEDPKNVANCDEKDFDTPQAAIAWLETKVPFALDRAEWGLPV